MTRETALQLLADYSWAMSNLVYLNDDSRFLAGMRDRFPDDGSERKAMRWLGFMQGALWALGHYTLDELKEHSRAGEVAS